MKFLLPQDWRGGSGLVANGDRLQTLPFELEAIFSSKTG